MTLSNKFEEHTTPHKPEQGMEGSTVRFDAPYVHYGPMPEILWKQEKKQCRECPRETHLQWQDGSYIYRLCQYCAKRKNGRFLDAIMEFLKP